MAEFDIDLAKKFFDNLDKWVALPHVKKFMMEWKKYDPITHKVIFNEGMGGTSGNFNAVWASIRTTLEIVNKNVANVNMTKDILDGYFKTMNECFERNAAYIQNFYLLDKSKIMIHADKFTSDGTIGLKPRDIKGSALKALVYVWYLAFPLSVIYNYLKIRVNNVGYLAANLGFTFDLHSSVEIRRKTERLFRPLHMKLRDEAKFLKYVESFSDVDSAKLFLSFSSIVRGIMQLK